jgi:hypothetical protein
MAARLKYILYQHSLFDFEADITDASTNTMAFRLVQLEINMLKIEHTCVSHVFPEVCNDDYEQRLNNRILTLNAQRQRIVSHHYMLSAFLDFPPEQTAQRFIRTIENWKGYKTYGDFENMLAIYLAPFCSKKGFLECLGYLSNLIDRDPRSGLSDSIRAANEGHFDDLEGFIANYQ